MQNSSNYNMYLRQSIKIRMKEIGIPLEKIVELSHRNKSTVLKVIQGIHVSKKDLEATTSILGLSRTGKEIKKANEIRKARAREKAIKIVSMVQSTSALEAQGLEKSKVNRMIIRTEREFLEGPYKSKLWK